MGNSEEEVLRENNGCLGTREPKKEHADLTTTTGPAVCVCASERYEGKITHYRLGCFDVCTELEYGLRYAHVLTCSVIGHARDLITESRIPEWYALVLSPSSAS